MKMTVLVTVLLFAGCASSTREPTCIPWGDEPCDNPEPKWHVLVHFDGDREPESTSYEKGWRAKDVAAQACGRVTSPWAPEKVTYVEVTRTKTGETDVIECSEDV
jgi:hypothetical protein